MRHLMVELMDRLVEHPLQGIDLIGRIIREAVRRSIKCLRPAQARVDPAKLGTVLEELHLELRIHGLKLRQAAEMVRVRIVKQLHRLSSFLRLRTSGGGIDDVMRSLDRKSTRLN